MFDEDLKEYALERAGEIIIDEVRIGLTYTAVKLDNGNTGLAMTFRNEITDSCILKDLPYAGKKLKNIITDITSTDLIDRTVALAAINALLNNMSGEFKPGDTLEMLNPGKDDITGMVGYFGPLVPKLKNRVKELIIFERNLNRAEGLYPEEKIEELMPECTKAIITSTTLLNCTFEKISKSIKKCEMAALVGASTPLVPELFKKYGIGILSGVLVTDPEAILRTVSESGGMQHFKGMIKKVNCICS